MGRTINIPLSLTQILNPIIIYLLNQIRCIAQQPKLIPNCYGYAMP